MFSRLVIPLLAILALTFSEAGATVERRLERRFELPTEGAAVLRLTTFSGTVQIVETDARVIELVVIQQADVKNEADMDKRLAQLKFTITQEKALVDIRCETDRQVAWTWQNWSPVQLTYELKVPRQCDLTITSRDGGIVIGNVRGVLTLQTEKAPIFTGEIEGSVNAKTNTGTVAVTACTGPVTIKTVTGNITVGRCGGRAELTSDGGYIELQRADNAVVIRGHGSEAKVGLTTPIRQPVDIKASGGQVVLIMETTNACALDLRASIFGEVKQRGALPLTITRGSMGSTRLAGLVNAGGPRVAVNASGGSIVLRGIDPLPAAAVEDPTALPLAR
jgi:hypothetical protein